MLPRTVRPRAPTPGRRQRRGRRGAGQPGRRWPHDELGFGWQPPFGVGQRFGIGDEVAVSVKDLFGPPCSVPVARVEVAERVWLPAHRRRNRRRNTDRAVNRSAVVGAVNPHVAATAVVLEHRRFIRAPARFAVNEATASPAEGTQAASADSRPNWDRDPSQATRASHRGHESSAGLRCRASSKPNRPGTPTCWHCPLAV